MTRPDAARPIDAVYLSPHLDDAAFSCGGQIHARARRGERVVVVTVFAGPAPAGSKPGADRLSPFAASLHHAWGLDIPGADAVAARRVEDRGALAVLGAEPVHLELPDAIYRSGGSGAALYPTFAALFGDLRPEDEVLVSPLYAALAAFNGCPFVAAPLGVGAHVDHRIVRDAALEAIPAARLWLYEEFPYAESFSARRRASAKLGGWGTRTERIDEVDLAAKCRAIACYPSQLGTAFRDDRELERRLRRFAKRRGGERLWQPPA